MKRLILLLAVILSGSFALAQATTMPAVDGPVKILVIPFGRLGIRHRTRVGGVCAAGKPHDGGGWEYDRAGGGAGSPAGKGRYVASDGGGEGDRSIAGCVWRFQYSDSQLRVTGEVVDVNYGKVLGVLKATGGLTDLFKIEDTIGAQLEAMLPQPPSNLPVVVNGPPDQSASCGLRRE